jgi:hypothetical protein
VLLLLGKTLVIIHSFNAYMNRLQPLVMLQAFLLERPVELNRVLPRAQ